MNTVTRNVQRFIREIPFAVAKGLTDTARDAQQEILAKLPGQFTLRTGWWKPSTPFGFKIEMAKKDNLKAAVFTKAPWMFLQEDGGVKKPASGQHLALPTQRVRRTKRDLVQKSQRPRNLKKAFKIKMRNGEELLAVRIGRGKRSELRFMYLLERQAKVPARLHFYETFAQVCRARLQLNLRQAMAYALRTGQ